MTKKIQTIISFVALLIVLGGGLWYFKASNENATVVADKAMDYLNNNLLSYGLEASLINVTEKKDVIKINFEIEDQQYTSYATKDGELFFLEAVNLDEELAALQEKGGEDKEEEVTEIPQSARPKVDLFVMSFCPFGNEAENTIKPVYDLLKDDIDFNINYIVNAQGDEIQSLHGQKEIDQNIREVCVKQNYGMDQYWNFTTYVNDNCGSDGSCWEEAANEIGINAQEIQSCFDENGLENMKEEARITKEAGVAGSPTMLINEVKTQEVYNYGEPNIYKEVICSAFTEEEKPEACSQVLSPVESSAADGGGC